MRKTAAITNIISPSIRRHMREVEAPAHFLLFLRPGVTKLDFVAVADRNGTGTGSLDEDQRILDQAFEDILERIKKTGSPSQAELSNTASLFKLCYAVVSRAKQLAPKFNDQHVPAVGVRWLEQESLSLGDVVDSSQNPVLRWRSTRSGRASLRFQDAIDWYAEYKSSIAEAKHADPVRYKGYEEYGSGRRKTILRIPTSASRPNIVNLSNLKVFLAEHLLAYKEYDQYVRLLRTPYATEPDGEPGLTFYFLPIKGLGQYRAAINWVGIDGYKMNSVRIENDLSYEASSLQRLGLESLFTQSLIRSASTSLRQALTETQTGNYQTPEGLYQAFADLWWATEVRFFKSGRLQNNLIRAEGEEDTTWVVSTENSAHLPPNWETHGHSYKGFLATAGKGHPHLTYIRLSLSSLADSQNDTERKIAELLTSSGLDYRDLEKTINSLPFDEVVFACYFFHPLQEDLAEWVDQLADSVAGVLIEQTVQRTRIVQIRAQTAERLGHWLNGLMRSVGRARAAKNLREAMKLTDDDDALALLREVSNSLQLMVLPEAGASLFRLYGTMDQGDFYHLRKWFTVTSRREWNEPVALEKYKHSVTHLTRAIAGARGHTRIDVVIGGHKTEYSSSCELDLDGLRFPPLSKGEKVNEPILALLPALTEPLENLLNYLHKKKWLGSEFPIVVEIEDLRQTETPSILVSIGNPFSDEDEMPERHGLARAQQLLKGTGLATIGHGEKRDVSGMSYYFVPVYLHPQRLAETIDKQDELNGVSALCI